MSFLVTLQHSCWLKQQSGQQSGQTKDYNIGICCFSTKDEVLRNMSKSWLALNQDNVSEWSNISNIKIQYNVLVYYKVDIIIIITCSCNDIHKHYTVINFFLNVFNIQFKSGCNGMTVSLAHTYTCHQVHN